MTERIPKIVVIAAAVLAVLALAYMAYSRPWYFTSQSDMAALIFLEFLLAAVWMYRRVFFAVVLGSFLLAGVNLPVGSGWNAARWVVLGVGALVGVILMARDRLHDFGLFHLVAFFAVLTGLTSAAVSQYPSVALLKVLSILLLFVYAATGARIAAIGRENSFFNGLLVGCEIFIGANAVFYGLGIQAMGNPNSLGAITGIIGAPILLWGVLQGGNKAVFRRRLLLYGICIYLAFLSHARAGIAAALLSSAILCVVMRKYKLLIEGVTVLVIVLAATALFRPQAISYMTSSVVYKNQSDNILASRISPWQTAMDNIHDHPWFGMGLGTTANGGDADAEQGSFASSGTVTAEHGSSYLAILAGVGIIGTIPFALMLCLVTSNIVRTIALARASGDVAYPGIVLAAVMIAGIVHATFEDWLLAPGNYLCVFFWSLAFVFNDLSPRSQRFAFKWNATPTHGVSGRVVSSS